VTWKVEANGRAGDRSQLVGLAEGYTRPSILCRPACARPALRR
jgi:hypothetical protein